MVFYWTQACEPHFTVTAGKPEVDVAAGVAELEHPTTENMTKLNIPKKIALSIWILPEIVTC